MARGVSTVLDVAVCLVLVGAAVATLATAPAADEASRQPDADGTAARLATVTAPVSAADHGTVHDTLAGHIATASVANATASSGPLHETSYPASVRDATANATDDRTFVTATWSPYPGSPLGGEATAGREPPTHAETAATVIEVDSGVAPPEATGTIDALAAELAAAYVRWLFPPERTDARLRDGRTADRTADRYRTAASALDATVEEHVAESAVARANEELAEALAERLEDDIRRRYGTASAAADDVTIDTVEIVVRRWEP